MKMLTHYNNLNASKDLHLSTLGFLQVRTLSLGLEKTRIHFESQFCLPSIIYLGICITSNLKSLQCRCVAVGKDLTKSMVFYVQMKAITRSSWNHAKLEEKALNLQEGSEE
jgi:hypothetical protein